MTKRPTSLSPKVEARMERVVDRVDERLASDEPTADVVQDLLARIHGDGRVYDRWEAGESLSLAEHMGLDTYHPRHVQLKADHWAETDEERFRESKPLWLWAGFDASPLADNVAVGTPARGVESKPGWESVADDPGQLTDNREERRIEYDLPDELDPVDEFERDLSPPDLDGTSSD